MADLPALDIHLAKIIRGYLSTAAAVTAGLPSTTVLPRVDVYNEKAKTFPVLVVAGALEGEGRRQRVNIVAALHAQYASEKATDDATTPERETHALWMATVQELFHKHSALYAYIAALPEADRTGWQLRRLFPGRVGTPAEDKTTNTEVTACNLSIDVRLPAYG